MTEIRVSKEAAIILDYVHNVQRHEPMCEHAKIIGPHEGNPKFWSVESVPRALIADDDEQGITITCVDCILQALKSNNLL